MVGIATREGALDALAPGHAADSELLQRVVAVDDDDVMPPPHAGRRLDARRCYYRGVSKTSWSAEKSPLPLQERIRPTGACTTLFCPRFYLLRARAR